MAAGLGLVGDLSIVVAVAVFALCFPLWHRIDIGMPLQVDAVFPYIIGKNTFQLTTADLKFDSPYNTYRHAGMPPGPIANPGRASIRAALNPAPNPPVSDPICRDLKKSQRCEYIYYVIADKEGGHVFAATLEQHEANVAAAREAGLIG